jgi:undecaprenyl-diphosphatase
MLEAVSAMSAPATISSLVEAALLGALQGVTEFLPVSSDGHLALAEMLFDVDQGGLTLNVMLHAGTLIATCIVLRRRVGAALLEGAHALRRPARLSETPGGRDALTVIVATIPTAVIGLGLRDLVETWTRSPLVVGLGFVMTAILLASTRWVRPGDDEMPGVLGAFLIGIAQGIAVLPGVSRSGSTITLALWLGVRPDRAFELSMLMSLPAVLGAVLLEVRHVTASGAGAAALGAVVACGTGVAALLALRRVVVRGHFALFALWVLPVAIATLAMARAWPH